MRTFLETKEYSTFKNWVDNGILYIRHLIGSNGNFLSFDEFRRQFPAVRIDCLLYEGIMRSIKVFQKDTRIELTNCHKAIESKVWFTIQRGNKHFQYVLPASEATPTGLRLGSGMKDLII